MQNENCKLQNARNDISERLLDFSVEIIKMVINLNKNAVERHIGSQLARSGTSAGTDY